MKGEREMIPWSEVAYEGSQRRKLQRKRKIWNTELTSSSSQCVGTTNLQYRVLHEFVNSSSAQKYGICFVSCSIGFPNLHQSVCIFLNICLIICLSILVLTHHIYNFSGHRVDKVVSYSDLWLLSHWCHCIRLLPPVWRSLHCGLYL